MKKTRHAMVHNKCWPGFSTTVIASQDVIRYFTRKITLTKRKELAIMQEIFFILQPFYHLTTKSPKPNKGYYTYYLIISFIKSKSLVCSYPTIKATISIKINVKIDIIIYVPTNRL